MRPALEQPLFYRQPRSMAPQLPTVSLLLFALSPGASSLNGGAALAGPGVHLSLGRAAGEVAVTWATPRTRAPAFLRYSRCAPPACKPRDAPSALANRVAADSTTLANNEAKTGPYTGVQPWRNISVHTALITDLRAAETIFYAVSGDPDPGRVLNFTSTTPHGRP